METLVLSRRRLSRNECLTGVGGSVLVHGLVVLAVVVSIKFAPLPAVKMQYCAVDLVSLADMGGGGDPSAVTNSPAGKGGDGPKASESHASAPAKAKSGPPVALKRLHFDEPSRRSEPELKRIESHEVPKVVEKAPAQDAVDRSVESLIAKPKTQPKATTLPPVPKDTGEGRSASASARSSASKSEESASSESESGEKPGTARGSGKGAASGAGSGTATAGAGHGGGAAGTSGGTVGGPQTGARVSAALLGMYAGKVRDAVRRQWVVLDPMKTQSLETMLLVVVNRDGSVSNLQVEKRSGNSFFDEAAVRAVKKASPLPPLPETFAGGQLEFTISFRPEGLS